MRNLFKSESKNISIFAPVNGKQIGIEQVNDSVFSSKMMGEGCAIIPTDGVIYAPCDGKIIVLPESLHAFGIRTYNGSEILVHVGLDTVVLGGAGFTKMKDLGSTVKAGTPILKVDIGFIKEKGFDTTTIIVVTNSNDFDVKIILNVPVVTISSIILETR